MPKIEICQCELSGELHIIENGKACELCNATDRTPFTVENVKEAFKYLNALVNSRTHHLRALTAALTQIAAFDDKQASEHLEACGSYGMFDEPGSVEIARKALPPREAPRSPTTRETRQIVEYTLEEGGEWRNLIIHALRLPNGAIWDSSFNDFRPMTVKAAPK